MGIFTYGCKLCARGQHWMSSSITLYFLKQGPSLNLELTSWLDGQPMSSRDWPVSAPSPSGLEVKVHAIIPRSYMDAGICIQGLKRLCSKHRTDRTISTGLALHFPLDILISDFMGRIFCLWYYTVNTLLLWPRSEGYIFKVFIPPCFYFYKLIIHFCGVMYSSTLPSSPGTVFDTIHSIGEAFHWGLYWVSHY